MDNVRINNGSGNQMGEECWSSGKAGNRNVGPLATQNGKGDKGTIGRGMHIMAFHQFKIMGARTPHTFVNLEEIKGAGSPTCR